MADTRTPDTTAEITKKPAKGRTATPSNVPQTAGPASKDGPSHDEISKRAYELYHKRGGQHGLHEQDWHEAERQLREERQAGGAAKADGAPKTSGTTKSTASKTGAKKPAATKATTAKSAAKQATAEDAGATTKAPRKTASRKKTGEG